MTPARSLSAARFVALLIPIALLAQSQAPVVRILDPPDDGYVSGPTLLRAEIVPQPSGPASVSFFVDQRLTCVVERPPYECSWDAGIAIKAYQIRVVAQIAGGPRLTATVQTKGEEYTLVENVERVRVHAVVTSRGRYVDGLKRDAFRILEDGVVQPITFFDPGEAPLEIIVAIDVSGSMAAAMPTVRAAVRQFLLALKTDDDDSVRLMGFNDNPITLTRPGDSLEARLRAVDLLEPWGTTSLRDTIARLLAMMTGNEGRQALVVFTDGDDTSSSVSREELQARAERSDASLYLVAQGRGVELNELRQELAQLAERSGGLAFFPDKVDKLAGIFDDILRDLSHQYVLFYVPKTDDDNWHKLSVSAGKYKVRARQGRRRPSPGKK
jgi:VWFA-related protein